MENYVSSLEAEIKSLWEMLSERDAEIKSLKSSLQLLQGKHTDLSDKEEANIKLHAWYEESLTPLKSK